MPKSRKRGGKKAHNKRVQKRNHQRDLMSDRLSKFVTAGLEKQLHSIDNFTPDLGQMNTEDNDENID